MDTASYDCSSTCSCLNRVRNTQSDLLIMASYCATLFEGIKSTGSRRENGGFGDSSTPYRHTLLNLPYLDSRVITGEITPMTCMLLVGEYPLSHELTCICFSGILSMFRESVKSPHASTMSSGGPRETDIQ